MATTFNLEKLQEVLEQYKAHFEEQWTDEKYKWRAVKHFQEHWDMDAADFAGMLARSLEKTGNLLASYSNYPREMILRFAKAAPEEVRAMFRALFDESADVVERITAFKQQAVSLLEQFGDGAAHHYQYENSITTYLWLRYPDKYYIYKYGEVKNVAEFLESPYRFRKGIYAENIRNCFSLYGQINKVLQEDAALVELVRSHATGVYYPDAELKTLTIDVGFYISRHCLEKDEETEEVDTPAENENRAPALWKISHGAGSPRHSRCCKANFGTPACGCGSRCYESQGNLQKIPRPGICGRDPAGRLLLSVLWKPHPAVGKNYHRTGCA